MTRKESYRETKTEIENGPKQSNAVETKKRRNIDTETPDTETQRLVMTRTEPSNDTVTEIKNGTTHITQDTRRGRFRGSASGGLSSGVSAMLETVGVEGRRGTKVWSLLKLRSASRRK